MLFSKANVWKYIGSCHLRQPVGESVRRSVREQSAYLPICRCLLPYIFVRYSARRQHSYYRSTGVLIRPGRKQVTATEDFDFRMSYL
jgi:hypothetical protein